MTAYSNQKVNSIPKQTLSDRLIGKVDHIAKLGRLTPITTINIEENKIVEMWILFANWGFRMGKLKYSGWHQTIVVAQNDTTHFTKVVQAMISGRF